MNKTSSEAIAFANELGEILEGKTIDVEFGVAPSFIALTTLAKAKEVEFKIPLAAQNVHFEVNGAYTGEVSTSMLEEIGTKYVIIGHSERREMFNETDESVNKKVLKTLTTNMIPVMAYGETEAEFDAGKTKEVVERQLKAGLENISDIGRIVIAYEPIWAIGTGKTATPEQAQEICAYSRSILEEMFGKESADNVRILYGGSMNPGNIKELLAQPDIDGGLVGGASLEAKSYSELLLYNKG